MSVVSDLQKKTKPGNGSWGHAATSDQLVPNDCQRMHQRNHSAHSDDAQPDSSLADLSVPMVHPSYVAFAASKIGALHMYVTKEPLRAGPSLWREGQNVGLHSPKRNRLMLDQKQNILSRGRIFSKGSVRIQAEMDSLIVEEFEDNLELAELQVGNTTNTYSHNSNNNSNSISNTTQMLATTTNNFASYLQTNSSLSELFPRKSVLLLNAVAIIWGTQHSIIKLVVEDCEPSAFSLARFGLGALIASPFTPGLSFLWESSSSTSTLTSSASKNEQALAWRWGIEMGLWMFLGYAFQAVALSYTSAQRSGFLLYLNVKFVPFFARILFGRSITVPTWISAFTALVGTALLAGGGGGPDLNVGDAISIAAAATSAMFILRLESASKAVTNSAQLNAACLWVVTLLAFVWSIAVGAHNVPLDSTRWGSSMAIAATKNTYLNVIQTVTTHPWELLYLGAVTTALANYIQTQAQRDVTAERASIIYAMDPVYGAVFAYLLLGEQMNGIGIIGAGLITLAAAFNAFLDFGDGSDEATKVKATKQSEDIL